MNAGLCVHPTPTTVATGSGTLRFAARSTPVCRCAAHSGQQPARTGPERAAAVRVADRTPGRHRRLSARVGRQRRTRCVQSARLRVWRADPRRRARGGHPHRQPRYVPGVSRSVGSAALRRQRRPGHDRVALARGHSGVARRRQDDRAAARHGRLPLRPGLARERRTRVRRYTDRRRRGRRAKSRLSVVVAGGLTIWLRTSRDLRVSQARRVC